MINTTKIAKSNLKQNKSKSILILITIILATGLLSALAMTCADWSESNKARVREYSGTFHGAYASVDDATYEKLKIHADIKETGVSNGIGIKEIDDKTKIGIMYLDENAIDFNSTKLIEGKFPIKSNEIVLDDIALEKLGYEKKIGQKIELTYEDFSKKGEITSEFILTGITKASDMAKMKKAYMATVSKDYMTSTRDMSKENYIVYITLNKLNNLSYEEIGYKVEEIGEDLEIAKINRKINEDYINTLKPDEEVMIWGVVIGAVVLLSSVLVIYNIFYLSIVTKVQEYGKLRAIGATKKQIKEIVLKEGMILSIIAIPIGVAVGFILNKFLLSQMFAFTEEIPKLPIVIGVIVISLLSVFVSLLKPMKVASKVSIVDAVRYNGQENSKNKTRKGYNGINLKRLACANLSRNKKRTYITIISLSLSGIIFIVISCWMNSIDGETMARNHFPSDIGISLTNYTFGDDESPQTEINMIQMNNPLGEEFVNQILGIDGVTKIEKSKDLKVELKGNETSYKYHSLVGANENDLEELALYLEDGKVDLEKLKSDEEIIIYDSSTAKEANIKVGDIITLTIYDGDKQVDKDFKVQAISGGSGSFAVHDDVLDKLVKTDATTSLGLYVEKDKYDSVKAYVENLVKSNEYFEASYIDDEIDTYKFLVSTTKAIGYSLVVIIGIIGFINLINSMISSIITRKKELGMLQAIGLTDKQLVKMLNIEAMFYTSIMLFTSLTLGNALGYVAVYIFRKTGGSYAEFTLPIAQILIMVVCVVLAQLLLTYLISKNFNKESLIDRVRYSE